MVSYRFVAGSKSVLLATDLAVQGLDIPTVEQVIHYQAPKTTKVCPCVSTNTEYHVFLFSLPIV